MGAQGFNYSISKHTVAFKMCGLCLWLPREMAVSAV